MRVADGAFRTGKDKTGAAYHLHHLDGSARAESPPLPPAPPRSARADPDLSHRVYSALLARLSPSKAHRAALQQRGLTAAEIDLRGYCTLPVRGRAQLARELRKRFGDALLSVPGFVLKQGKGGLPYLTIAGAAGLLVPVRDPAGRIVALMVRRDDSGDGRGKYSWLSSAAAGGPGPGTPAHVPQGVTGPCHTCRLTEGALKADVAFALSGLPTVGAAGLGWQPALDTLRELGCRTVRLAFDADSHDNPHVARALADCAEAAAGAGLAVELERWDLAAGKGIDDLLAGGQTPEVLTGETATAAIREARAAATAGEPSTTSNELERLTRVLAAGGAAALFVDKPLLQALARLAADDPAAYAACRAGIKGVVSVRDLDRALEPLRREQAKDRPPVLLTEAGYRIQDGRICSERGTREGGSALIPLCNFTARIVETVTRDDGAEQSARFALTGQLADGRPLPRVTVDAEKFPRMEWVTPSWHGEAVAYAGQGTRDHLRCAIELLSGDRARRTVYLHLGWRRISDDWLYLHAAGAIGTVGTVAGMEVEPPAELANFVLPEPPAGEGRSAAVRASLALLSGLAHDRIIFPLLAAVYRAALGEAPGLVDLSLFLAGPHGTGKSELSALCQQHFGAGLDSRHLPGSWSSTANALEALAFAAKDALLVVDDWAPRGAPGDRQRLERDADRLLRAQGNRSGRQRMRADGSLRPERPPRGLILSTGEDLPAGQSLRGRVLAIEVSPGDVPLPSLTPYQHAAAAGLYAQALAGFLRWLAPQYDELCRRLPGERAALRDRAMAEARGGSPRTPGIIADLALGLNLSFDFARAVGAITKQERADLLRRGWQALLAAAAAQSRHVQDAEPTGHFLRLLTAALASGRAHVADADGREPQEPAAWGWRREYSSREGPTWKAQGRRVGWMDKGELYLEPEASYAAAQELARDQGEALPVSPNTLHRRLKERSLLESWDEPRQRNTVRRTLEGVRHREVLHLSPGALSPCEIPSIPSTPSTGGQGRDVTGDGDGVSVDGLPSDPVDGHTAGGGKPSTGTVHKPRENEPGGRNGRNGRFPTGGDGAAGKNKKTPGRRSGAGWDDEPANPPGKGDAYEGD